MSSILAAESSLTHATGGHPILVPALLLAGILIILAVAGDYLITAFLHPMLEMLGLRNRRRTFESARSTRSTLRDQVGPTVVVSPSGQCFLTLFPGRSDPGQQTQK